MAKYGTAVKFSGYPGRDSGASGAGGGNLAGALAGASAPELAHLLKSTEKDPAVNAIAHAILGGAVAAMQGNNAAAVQQAQQQESWQPERLPECCIWREAVRPQ